MFGSACEEEGPLEALRGGIPCSFLEPLARFWSHFVGIYRQKLTTSPKKTLDIPPRKALRGLPDVSSVNVMQGALCASAMDYIRHIHTTSTATHAPFARHYTHLR